MTTYLDSFDLEYIPAVSETVRERIIYWAAQLMEGGYKGPFDRLSVQAVMLWATRAISTNCMHCEDTILKLNSADWDKAFAELQAIQEEESVAAVKAAERGAAINKSGKMSGKTGHREKVATVDGRADIMRAGGLSGLSRRITKFIYSRPFS